MTYAEFVLLISDAPYTRPNMMEKINRDEQCARFSGSVLIEYSLSGLVDVLMCYNELRSDTSTCWHYHW